jgi:hypothetical protein
MHKSIGMGNYVQEQQSKASQRNTVEGLNWGQLLHRKTTYTRMRADSLLGGWA